MEGDEVEEFIFTTRSESASSFKCRARWKTRTSEVAAAKDYICRGRNLKVVVNKTAPARVGLQVWPDASWKLPAGKHLKLDAHFGRNVNVTLMNADEGRGQCDETDDRTIVLWEIGDTWNPFEGGHQLVMAYVSVLALKLDPQRLRVLLTRPFPLTDSKGRPKASWQYDFLSMVLSRGGPMISPDTWAARTICATDIVVPSGGDPSPLHRTINRDDPNLAQCQGGAPLFLGMKQFVIQALNVQPVAPSVSLGDRLIMLVRKPSTVHPGQFKRVFENFQEVADALSSRETYQLESNALALVGSFLKQGTRRVTVLSPETLTLVEQVQEFADADFVLSPHAASLTWMYLMPQCGQVLEFCTGADFHYVNIAHYAGMHHRCLSGLRGWGTPSFKANVADVLRQKDAATKAWQTCVQRG